MLLILEFIVYFPLPPLILLLFTSLLLPLLLLLLCLSVIISSNELKLLSLSSDKDIVRRAKGELLAISVVSCTKLGSLAVQHGTQNITTAELSLLLLLLLILLL